MIIRPKTISSKMPKCLTALTGTAHENASTRDFSCHTQRFLRIKILISTAARNIFEVTLECKSR